LVSPRLGSRILLFDQCGLCSALPRRHLQAGTRFRTFL